MPKRIILDVDTGTDDAVAIMTAICSPELILDGICTVAGNKDIDKTTENTLRVVQAMESSVPVYRGCHQPLVKNLVGNRLAPVLRESAMVEGQEVFLNDDYLDLPPATIDVQEMPAAAFYVDYLMNCEEAVTIVAVGPLTNLATALIMEPAILEGIEQIVIMGGGYKITNITSSAEFNIWSDAEAAEWVLKSGANILWVPLDATHAACVTMADCQRFRQLETLAGDFSAELTEQSILFHNVMQPLEVPDAAAVHDALAVCAAIDPAVLRDVRHVHMDIGLEGYAEGQTIIDPRYYPEERNCWFAFDADREKFVGMLCDIFAQ